MNSVKHALNTLISAVNVAHNKGGVYSLEESHYIYTAISFLQSLQDAPAAPEAPVAEVAPVETAPRATTDEAPQGY